MSEQTNHQNAKFEAMKAFIIDANTKQNQEFYEHITKVKKEIIEGTNKGMYSLSNDILEMNQNLRDNNEKLDAFNLRLDDELQLFEDLRNSFYQFDSNALGNINTILQQFNITEQGIKQKLIELHRAHVRRLKEDMQKVEEGNKNVFNNFKSLINEIPKNVHINYFANRTTLELYGFIVVISLCIFGLVYGFVNWL